MSIKTGFNILDSNGILKCISMIHFFQYYCRGHSRGAGCRPLIYSNKENNSKPETQASGVTPNCMNTLIVVYLHLSGEIPHS